MADQRDGGIAWSDETWNPVRGCSRVSPGCVNCYAERQAARFSGPGQPYDGLVRIHTRAGPETGGERPLAHDDVKLWEPRHREARWTGVVRLVPEHLADPLRWRRPRRVFVNSMSDLFHEKLSDEDIAAVFGVMAAAPQHQFQVLTKRAKRMREWFAVARRHGASAWCVGAAAATGALAGHETARAFVDHTLWPKPNVWLGVSVEDQKRADERIPELLATPSAVRWVSYEPAVGPIAFRPGWLSPWSDPAFDPAATRLDWIVVGGESGPGARPFDLSWARSTIRQCREAGVAAFFKQAGSEWARGRSHGGRNVDRKGGDPTEWPEDLRVRQWPEVTG